MAGIKTAGPKKQLGDSLTSNLSDFTMHDVPAGNKRFVVERKNGRLKVSAQ